MNKWSEVILRVALGLVFLLHGVAKFSDGIEGVEEFFISLSIPGFLAIIVATIETVGGILMILGLIPRIVAALFIIVLIGAMTTVTFPLGFVGGFELEFILFIVSFSVFLNNGWKQWNAWQPNTVHNNGGIE